MKLELLKKPPKTTYLRVRNDYFKFHIKIFQKLAEEAEEKIEDTDPPLFLRFINLLINDAIFLLDEAFDVSKQEEINLCSMISTAEMLLGVSVIDYQDLTGSFCG